MTRLRRLTLTICAFHLGFSLVVAWPPTMRSESTYMANLHLGLKQQQLSE